MSTRRVVFFDTQSAPNVDTALYEVPSGIVSTIDKMVAYNGDTVARTVTVRLVPPAGTPTGITFILEKKTIQPGQSHLFQAIVGNELVEGATITVDADAADVVNIRCSGREDTAD